MSRSKTEIMRRLRLGNLRTLLRARCGYTLPDDDAGRDYLYELLLPVSLGPEAEQKIHNVVETWAPWMDARERFYLMAQIERTPAYVRKVKAEILGKRLRVTSAERERLKLWTIAPFDLTDKQLKEQRKAKHRARMQRRRRAAGSKPRDQSLNKSKPWKATGVSRATWFRKRANSRETDSCAVKFLNYRARNSLTEKTARPQTVAEHHRGGKAEIMSEAQNKPKDIESQHGHEPLADPRALRTEQSHGPNGHGGGLTARVWIREIRHPAIKSGPDDNLDDFKIAARI